MNCEGFKNSFCERLKTQAKKHLELICDFVLQSLWSDAQIERYHRTEEIDW